MHEDCLIRNYIENRSERRTTEESNKRAEENSDAKNTEKHSGQEN